MEPDDPRERFEARLDALRGRRLSAVDYWDVHDYAGEPAEWDYGDWHHAVMGVGLATDAGPVAVTWTSTFFPYGVEVFHDPIEDHLALAEDGPQRIGPDIGSGSPWDRYLETPIHGTATHWARLEAGPARRSGGGVAVPTAVRLDFAAGAVWFVAAIPEPPRWERVFVGGDEIMVVFSGEKMREIGFDDAEFVS